MEPILGVLQQEDVRLFEIFVREEITDLETFSLLDNDDFTRLKLSTKMVKTIQKLQKLLENDLVVEELEDHIEDIIETHADDVGTNSNAENDDRSFNLEQEINVDQIFTKTQTGREIQEFLVEGYKPTEKVSKQITHILCDYLVSAYGERPSTFYKEMLARSLVKTYPLYVHYHFSFLTYFSYWMLDHIYFFSSNCVSKISAVNERKRAFVFVLLQALWFYKNGRGSGRHSGKIHYRMEFLAKKSDKRVFHRLSDDCQTLRASEVSEYDQDEATIDDLVLELQFAVPTEQSKSRIMDLWKQTLRFRNNIREEGTFLQFMKDFPVATAFGGALISFDFESMRPNGARFEDVWNVIQPKILDQYRDVYRYIKNDMIKALAVVREKNPTRGAKRPRPDKEKEARKFNPLHGIIDWIDPEMELPNTEDPLIIVSATLFEDGDCNIIWKDISIPVGNNLLGAFTLLLQVFTVFNVKCCPSDKIFYSFFYAYCFKIEALSTTGNKFVSQLN
ncbi:uncharacterized protein LOC135702327 [Ochlerotatus camptorhynchus]|uniref:uncharacterized protein LOC135702327 n=1 Tax=Ochlerotatus camptorhynchus TaxID=644619 RepID=UPI0031CF1256